LDLLDILDRAYLASAFTRLSVVADNAKIHPAGEVEKWLVAHPRFELLFLPTYCPERIRLNAPLVMSMTSAPATIPVNNCGIWSKTSSSICAAMARGGTPSLTSITLRR
jgi:hypothetical protein